MTCHFKFDKAMFIVELQSLVSIFVHIGSFYRGHWPLQGRLFQMLSLIQLQIKQ